MEDSLMNEKLDDIISYALKNNIKITEIKKSLSEKMRCVKKPNKRRKKQTWMRPVLWISESSDNEN